MPRVNLRKGTLAALANFGRAPLATLGTSFALPFDRFPHVSAPADSGGPTR